MSLRAALAQAAQGGIVAHATRVEILPGCSAPVASVGHLVAMKLLSVREARPRDAQDLVALLELADAPAVARAEAACARITAVGASRGRDLIALLRTWQARAST